MGSGGGGTAALSLALSHLYSTAPSSPICHLLIVLGSERGERWREVEVGIGAQKGNMAPTQILATPSLSLHLIS